MGKARFVVLCVECGKRVQAFESQHITCAARCQRCRHRQLRVNRLRSMSTGTGPDWSGTGTAECNLSRRAASVFGGKLHAQNNKITSPDATASPGMNSSGYTSFRYHLNDLQPRSFLQRYARKYARGRTRLITVLLTSKSFERKWRGRCAINRADSTLGTDASITLPEFRATGDVTVVAAVVADALVVILCVVIQPHFRQPHAVPLQHVDAAAPLCRTYAKLRTETPWTTNTRDRSHSLCTANVCGKCDRHASTAQSPVCRRTSTS